MAVLITDLPGKSSVILGTSGDDALFGLDGDDTIRGLAGADLLDGGTGNDILDYFIGAAVGVTVTLGAAGVETIGKGGDAQGDRILNFEHINGGKGNDSLTGNDADNAFGGFGGNDVLDGGKGNDILAGGAGNDTLIGGEGNDTFVIVGKEGLNDIVLGGNGTDAVAFEGKKGEAVHLNGFNAAALSIEAIDWNSHTIVGSAAGELFDIGATTFAGPGSSRIDGGAGNDTIIDWQFDGSLLAGGAGDDTITGGGGNDTIDGGAGNDVMDGGTSIHLDTVVYVNATAAVTVNLSIAGKQNTGGAGTDTLKNFEIVEGSKFSDKLTGDDLDNELLGFGGNDTLAGGKGNDLLAGGAGKDTYDGGEDNDVFIIAGKEALADTFSGGAGTDGIRVFDGDVVLSGFNAGAVSIEEWDQFDGGIVGTAAANIFDFSAMTDFASDFVDGGAGDDKLIGSLKGEVLKGGAGKDTIIGNGGNDFFFITGAEAIADTFDGGANTDRIVVFGKGVVTLANFKAGASLIEGWTGNGAALLGTAGENFFDLASLTFISDLSFVDGGAGNDTIFGATVALFKDDLRGGAGDDALTGGAGNDTLTGGAGNDKLDGGADNDTFVITGAQAVGDAMFGAGGTADAIKVVGAATVMLNAFGDGVFSDGAIEIWQGNGKGLLGTAGENLFNFGAVTTATGMPFIDGGAGNDTIGGTALDDDLRGGAGEDGVFGGKGNDILTGGAGTDTVFGGENDDTLVIAGKDAVDDLLKGDTGFDSIKVVGAGAVTLANFNTGVDVLEGWIGNGAAVLGTAGDNTFNFQSLLSFAGVSFFDGGAGNDTLIGTKIADDLRGGTGDDTLVGFLGNDKLDGGAGDDQLFGAEGNDTLFGGAGKDELNGGDGNDTLIITGADAVNETLKGDLGTDSVKVMGAAAVTLAGFNDAGNSLEGWIGNGKGLFGTAGDNVFNLSSLTSISGLPFVDGGAGNDTLVGSQFADDLRGGADNDVFIGAAANDKITGGAGNDTFFYNLGGDADIVNDYAPGVDEFNFTGIAGLSTYNDVKALMDQIGKNVVIDFGAGDTLTIKNTTIAILDANQGDFLVV